MEDDNNDIFKYCKYGMVFHVAEWIKYRIVVDEDLWEIFPDLNILCNEHRQTPMYHAAYNGEHEVVLMLLRAGANPNITSGDGSTPLWIAVYNGHTQVVKVLLKYAEDLKVDIGAGTSCQTPLMIAASRGYDDIVELLVDRSDLDEIDDHNRTALFIACEEDGLFAAKILLSAGADATIPDHSLDTPLHVVLRNEFMLFRKEIVQELIDAGADVNAVNEKGFTPLHYAFIQEADEDVVDLLFNNNLDVHVLDAKGRNYIQYMIHYPKINLQRFLALGVDINHRDNKGRTVLLKAVLNTDEEIAQCLLLMGASPYVKDNRERSPLTVAQAMNCNSIVKMMRRHPIRRNERWIDVTRKIHFHTGG